VLGVAVLRESLTLGMLVGFALVLAGSGLATRRPGRPLEGRMIPVPDEPDGVGEVSR
jgi:drug/metabolite transporter (DMT)-like permease